MGKVVCHSSQRTESYKKKQKDNNNGKQINNTIKKVKVRNRIDLYVQHDIVQNYHVIINSVAVNFYLQIQIINII